MADYIATSPDSGYCGRTAGVLFDHGKAYFNEHTVDPAMTEGLPHSVDPVEKTVQLLRELGYSVQPVNGADVGEAVAPDPDAVKLQEIARTRKPVPQSIRAGRYRAEK